MKEKVENSEVEEKIVEEEKNETVEKQEKTKKTRGKKKEEVKQVKENKAEKPEKENKIEKIEEEKESKFEKVEKKSVKEYKEMYEKNHKKRAIIIVTAVLVIGILAIFSTIFSLLNLNNENIISGVSISGVSVSGLSKTEAMEKMKNIYDEKKEKEIGLKYEDYETSLNPTLMEVNYKVEDAVNKACVIGKGSNIIINNYNILFSLIFKNNVNVDMELNEEVAKQTIQDIGVNLPGVLIDSSYAIEGEELIITKGKEGIVIEEDKLLEEVKKNLNDINATEDDIEIPVINKKPEEIDIDKIHEEVCKEAKDAYYTKDPFTVYPEVEGVDFDIEEAKKILAEEKEEYRIPITITKPKITLNDIGTEAFPDKLSTFTTRYDVSAVDRTTNLIIACGKINGKVLLPGETFSYNKTLGARTAAAGYRNAKVYENGQVVDGIGGGICQISSTLYNAVLMANLEVVERRNHQFITSYLPAGRDATVVYGMTDFKFKNTRQYPVRIVASAQNGIATVSVYGIKEENEYTFSFSTKTIASIPTSVKYEEDPTLDAGVEKVKQKGANGVKTETYITKMLDGKTVSTTLLSRDTYDAMQTIIIKGTKEAATAPAEQPAPAQVTPSTPAEKPKSDIDKKDTTKDTTKPNSGTGSSTTSGGTTTPNNVTGTTTTTP